MEPERDKNKARKEAEGEGLEKMNHVHASGLQEDTHGRKQGVRSTAKQERKDQKEFGSQSMRQTSAHLTHHHWLHNTLYAEIYAGVTVSP